jgi:hypothetical protein
MGGICSTYGASEEVLMGFCWRNLMERDHLEDAGVDGSIILKWILRKWDEGTYRIDLAQRRDRCWVLVNAVMNLLFP